MIRISWSPVCVLPESSSEYDTLVKTFLILWILVTTVCINVIFVWISQGVDLSAIYLNLLDDNLFSPLRIVAIFRWFGIVAGLLIIIASVSYR